MLEMKAAAVKLGSYRNKEGKEVSSNRVTFITDDGDSFKINTDWTVHAGDTVIFGVRSAMSDKGFPLVALTVETVRPATTPGGGK